MSHQSALTMLLPNPIEVHTFSPTKETEASSKLPSYGDVF